MAASIASALVESLTTSLNRIVVTIRFWLTGASAVREPNGATGDSSTPVNASDSSCHSLGLDRAHPTRVARRRLHETVPAPPGHQVAGPHTQRAGVGDAQQQ